MIRGTDWFLATCLAIAAPGLPEARSQSPAPEAADEARERKVMERFLGVLEKAPRRGTALDRVYGYHVERGSLDPFLKAYQARVVADPKDGASWLLIGLVEAQRGRDAAAVEALRKAEAARPDDPMPAYYLGQALVLVGQPDAAAEAFERALGRKPARADLLDIYQALGRVHQRAHRDDKALAVWDRLEKAFPDDPRVQEQIAHALADESRDAAALTRFEALAKSTRDRFRQVQFAIEAAELKVKLGKGPEALADFEALLGKLDPESWLYREVRRKVEDVFLRTDDLAGLASYYERWIKKTPDDVEAMARLGRTLAGQGRVADARKWLDRAVTLAPSRRELRLALIEQLVQDRKFADAAAQYEALAKLEPNNPDVVRDWGRMLLRDTSKPEADRKRAAAAVWRRLAPDDAKDAVGIAQAADLFRQAGLADEAIALYNRAIKLAPDSTQYREYLGEYYHALKRPADALATWRASAEGASKNARSLGRLGEVLAGFGYRQEAVAPLTEACKLEPDDFDSRLRLADLKLAMDRPLEALPELERAEKVASADEQAEAVLERLIRAYQASSTLAARIEALQAGLANSPTAAGWTRLARLLEADQKSTEAARAIGEATKIDPRSIPAWVATARLREAAGDLLGSAEALRTLTTLDRRSRTDYLTGIAKLEARLGRRGPALEAGRELLAAAPGNPDHHQFFAELCFQLGEPDEGLDALRRAARANPSDPKAMLTLAENLARQFRAEEAIELFWRAFARTPEVEGKLSIVSRMADQYLQRNQLDRLLGRLERELREPNQQRELSLCLAQAHAASGDQATARLELERLLSTNARDTQLLAQLSNLAEQEGDIAGAAKYQKQAIEIAPGAEGTARLAQLYLRSGEYVEAESIWTRSTEGDQDPGRALSAIDSLMASGKREPALLIAGRLLRTRPDDWELIYREGVALAGLNRVAEADGRFRSILALKLGDDEKGVVARSKGGGTAPTGGPAAGPKAGATRLPTPPIQDRAMSAFRARFATGIDSNSFTATVDGPRDFGQARVFAMAWRLGLARRENKQDDFLKGVREAKDKAPLDPRAAWDWYYLQLVRQDQAGAFEAARAVVKLQPSDEAAQWAYLGSLGGRTVGPDQQRAFRQPGSTAPDPTPALAAEEVDRVLSCYREYRKRRPDLAPANLADVLAELKRAGRSEDADRAYKETLASTAPDSANAPALINTAAERGDVDGLLGFLDRLERLPASTSAPTPVPGSNQVASTTDQTYGRMIGLRGAARAYPDVLAILDRFLAANARSREKIQATGRAGAPRPVGNRYFNNNNNNGVAYWINGQASRAVGIDFPTAGDRHDLAALGVIRTAFEVFKRDDMLSDLFAHLQARADAARGPDQVDALLVLGYCRWWNEDKDDAERAVSRAAELSGGNPSVRLTLAELHERQGSFAEALSVVDSLDAIDSSTVQKRENLALRLSVATGDVDRARKAAERLFGLRLDAEAQVQLAALMGQLGMHELAEAVLARARKSAGNKATPLLILMNQYRRQQKTDLALQIALQILRVRPMAASSGGQPAMPNVTFAPNGGVMSTFGPGTNTAAEDDAARREAMQVLSRSGKLDELVARAEAQLERSPNSIQVLQALAEYARVANDKAKLRGLFERMADTRPDDARFRIQLALQLLQGGDPEAALVHYRAAMKADPTTLATNFFPIMNTFRQANKFEEFATIADSIDLRAIGNLNAVMQIAQNLMNDPKARDRGMALFRRIWETFPGDRAMFINLLNNNPDWWRLPEVYDYAKDVIIPPPGSTTVLPWSGVDAIQAFQNDGRVLTLANRLLDAAARQDRLADLEAEVRRAIDRHPGWSGGKVILMMVLLREGRFDRARPIIRELMARVDEKEPMPVLVGSLIGQELDDYSAVQDLAEELYESSMKDFLARGIFDPNNNQVNPSTRLLARYQAAGRVEDSRKLVLKLAGLKWANPAYDPGYLDAIRINMMGAYAQQLAGLGSPSEAIRLYREQMALAESTAGDVQAMQYINVEGVAQQARQGIQQAVRGAKAEAFAPAVASMFRPGPGKPKPGEAIDLLLSVTQVGFDRDSVDGGMVELIRKVARPEGTPAEVASALAMLRDRAPDDFAVNVVAALLAMAEGKPAAIREATDRLVELVGRSPLEPLAGRPNARQRADAARQLGLWLVARECWNRPDFRATGDLLAARALEAGRRQPVDSRWAPAMLREWGQVALDRGDREQAERHWSALLDLALARADSKPSGRVDGRPDAVLATPREGFDRAMVVSRMAADRGLAMLSIKAVREAFRGGTPVGAQLGLDASNAMIGASQPQRGSNAGRGNVRRRVGNNQDLAGDAVTAPIEAALAELESLWTRLGVPPRQVYEALRDVVLPPGRPSEVDLYPLGLSFATIRHPRSTGDRLVGWAVRAGAADDLRRAVRARKSGNPIAELSGMVLLTQLDLASGRLEDASAGLGRIAAWLGKDTLKVSAELAAHAALPALEVARDEKSAESALDRAIKNLSAQPTTEPLGALIQAMAAHDLDRGRPAEARKRLDSFLDLQEKALAQGNNNAEFLNYYRRANLLRVAGAFVRRGLMPETMEALGRYADVPMTRYVEPSPNAVLGILGRGLAALPAAERYRMLKEWSLPTADRKSVRSVAGFLADTESPPAAFEVPNSARPGGVVATLSMLVEAASGAGKLDELADSARVLDEKSVEDARALLVLVEVARGGGEEVASKVEAMAVEMEKPVVFTQGLAPPAPIAAFLAARACLGVDRLATVGDRLAEALARRPSFVNNNAMTPQVAIGAHLRRDMLRSRAGRAGGRDLPIRRDPGLACWSLAAAGWTNPLLSPVRPAWFEHEGHVGLASSNQFDQVDLALAFPVAGAFEFSVDASSNVDEGESAVSFGSRLFGSRSGGMMQNGMNWNRMNRMNNGNGNNGVAPRGYRDEGSNRVTLRAESGRVRCLVNGFVVDDSAELDPTYPWIVLSGKGRASWRGPELSGKPEIPREVRISHADRLDSWSSTAYTESNAPRVPPPSNGPDQAILDAFDWASRDGEIRGRRLDDGASVANAQSRLTYDRALLDGESVTYSFLHEPGRVEVHPSLGRLAFLMDKDGVKLHWMTEGQGLDPTGLAADNAVVEASSRRGPSPIPLKPDAWNVARLSIGRGTIAIELNGQVVCERPVGPDDDRTFGLFHFKDRTAVRVKDVVLRGDWPEKFEAARKLGLMNRARPPVDDAERLAEHSLIGEAELTRDAGLVLGRTRPLPPPARFEALASWVLPGPDHPTIRLQGDFRPLDPAPTLTDAGASVRSRVQVGGELEAPATDLVEVARSSGRLDELLARVEAAKVDSPVDRRGRLALVAMIRMAQDRDAEAVAALVGLKELAGTVKPADLDWMRWPELIAAWSAMARPGVRPSATACLVVPGLAPVPEAGKEEIPWSSDLWARQVRQARAMIEALGRSGEPFGDDASLAPTWVPIATTRTDWRGSGYPRTSWTTIGGVRRLESGRGGDALLLRTPIRGDFEATCELSTAPGGEGSLSYAGFSARPGRDRKSLEVRQGDQPPVESTLDPPLEPKGDWATWKVAVKSGRMVLSIDGRVVLERPVPTEADPWLAIEAPGRLGASARNFRVEGKPVVPESLRLSALPDLVGWSSAEYAEPTDPNEPAWRKRGDEIVGRAARPPSPNDPNGQLVDGAMMTDDFDALLGKLPPPAFSKRESVLRYRRPLAEGGSVEYEFYHEPGKATVHPALDRLAFLISPDGVAIHRLTDGPHDRTGLDVGNVTVEPARRLGPASPPLRPKSWNRLKLALAGSTLKVTLNDVDIYERPVEPTNARTFGLFHFADESEARVRDVTYRGEWPRSVPPDR